MKVRTSILLVSAVALFALAVPCNATTLKYISGNGVAAGGEAVGLYKMSLNGKITNLVCDDFLDTVYTTPWTVTVGQTNPYSGTGYFDPSFVSNPFILGQGGVATSQELYNMIAYLVELIEHDNSAGHVNWGYESWAIWSLTDHAWNQAYYLANAATIEGYLQAAYDVRDTFKANLHIYTPTDCTASKVGQPGSCGGVNAAFGRPPQEFLGASEASTPLLLVVTLLTGGIFRKKLSDLLAA